jgi:hypothetical protein
MFKLVKWAFHLGQQTERQRIELILTDASYRSGINLEQYFDEGRQTQTSERKKKEARIQAEVEQRIMQIVGNITRFEPTDSEAYSLLYPKDDK